MTTSEKIMKAYEINAVSHAAMKYADQLMVRNLELEVIGSSNDPDALIQGCGEAIVIGRMMETLKDIMEACAIESESLASD